jgi:hypothetical protein
MKNQDPNQGEGDRVSARHYNRRVREFVAAGKVSGAARDAEKFVEREPDEAARAERAGKRGPASGARATVDELVAKGRTVIDRVRPMVERVASRIRTRLSSK